MVRLSSSPGARIASLRSLSTSRPTTPGCAASHHLGAGDASGSAGGRRFSSSVSRRSGWSSVVTTVMEAGPPRRSPGSAAACHEWSKLGESSAGERCTIRIHGMSTRRSGAPRRGSQQGRSGQQGHQGREARDAPRDEQRHENHRQAPSEQHKATTPEATAPRSGSPSGQTRRAQERAPASHREERQAATPHQDSTAHARGRRPSSSDTRSEASRITCETRAEGRPREPTAWGRGARGRFLGRPVSPESCGKVPIDRGDAFSWPHRGRLIGLDT